MANFGKPNLDFTLFLRPFTRGSWTIVGILTLTCFSVALVYQISPIKKYQGQDSARIVTFMIWMFFLLVISYYRGSLTKYFTTKATHPFTTLRQGLANNDWKLILVEGTQMLVQPFAKGDNPDPLFKRWWQAAHASEAATKEYILPTHKEAVIKLLEPRHFFMETRIRLLQNSLSMEWMQTFRSWVEPKSKPTLGPSCSHGHHH